MKGKTGKPSAMRGGGIARKGIGAALKGGGLARKGVGMALKGGGIARKGTGSNSTPGGKKMAMGGMSEGKRLPGTPPRTNAPSRPSVSPSVPSRPSGEPVFGPGGMPGVVKTPKTPDMVRPGFPVGGIRGTPRAYAKGGSVKMTAGAGSGSGRLEKAAAHKAAKRVPATGLKGGGLSKLLTKISPAAMLLKGELPNTGLLGIGLKGLRGDENKGMNPDEVKKNLGLKKGGKVKRK